MELHVSQFMGQGASALPSDIRVVKQLKAMAADKINDITVSAKSLHADITPEQTATIGMLTLLSSKCEAAITRDEREYGTFAGGRNRGSQRPNHNPLNLVAPGAGVHAPSRTQGNGWLSKLWNQANEEERDQIENLFAHMSGQKFNATANLSPTGDGGNLIPTFVANQIEMHVAAFTPVLNVSRIYGTEDGAGITYPVLSDSESAEQLAAEDLTGLDDVVSGDTPPTSLAGVKLGAWKVSSKPVLMPRELTTDTGLDIGGDVLTSLIARIARFENLKYTRGNGTTEAQGFLTACTHYDVSTPVSLDMCLDLTQQVEPLYRPNGVFMMSDVTKKYLSKLKTGISGDQRPLWGFGNASDGAGAADQQARLWGYPVFVNNDMPDIASNGYLAGHEIAFGDFQKYVIRRAEFGVPFTYSWPIPAKDGRALICFRRSDAKLLVSTAIATFAVGGS
jgi:HK97 family phage major capsid protein